MYKTVFSCLNINGVRIKCSDNIGVKKINIIDGNGFLHRFILKNYPSGVFYCIFICMGVFKSIRRQGQKLDNN